MDLNELAERVEALAGPDAEVDALIRCALFAGSGAYVKQSPINGSWCIYELGYGGKERNWEPRGLSQEHRLGSFTESIDAAMTLVSAEAFWRLGHDGDGADPSEFRAQLIVPMLGGTDLHGVSIAATPALALTAAALRARSQATSQ